MFYLPDFMFSDVLTLPGLQARQQRAAAVYSEAAGTGPDELPAQPLRRRAGRHRSLREGPRR